jgi:hypothetical protein
LIFFFFFFHGSWTRQHENESQRDFGIYDSQQFRPPSQNKHVGKFIKKDAVIPLQRLQGNAITTSSRFLE